MDDDQIIDLYLNRSESAISATQEKYGARLRRFSMSIVGDLSTAEECENDTYLRVWRSIPPNAPRDHFYSFLAAIVRNLSLNSCRNRSRLKRSAFVSELTEEMRECIPGAADPYYELEADVLRARLNSFLRDLDEKKRNIFLRRYWYLDSIPDIAERYHLSESNIKIILFRCRNRLRETLEKEGYKL